MIPWRLHTWAHALKWARNMRLSYPRYSLFCVCHSGSLLHKDARPPNMPTTAGIQLWKHLFSLMLEGETAGLIELRDFVLFPITMLSRGVFQGYILRCLFALQANYKIHLPYKM